MKDGTRINKYLADHFYASRRASDELIAEGKVFINGKVAVLGDKVDSKDKVTVEGMDAGKPVYYKYYKPRGIVTVGPQGKEKAIADVTKFPETVYPVGRLDKESEGLIIMTNDGRLATRLLDPSAEYEKEYEVEVGKDITNTLLVRVRTGVGIGKVGKSKNYLSKPALVRRKSKRVFEIVITEGKNRQIRRMVGAVGYKVVGLKRFRIGSVALKKLTPGEYKEIKGIELEEFLGGLGL